MDVALGSTNPVKQRAVDRVVDGSVVAVDVDSGVSEQPETVEETITGAETRARRALATTNCSLGIGLEGGVTTDGPRPGGWLVMWASATDGQRLEWGSGPSIRLPPSVVERLEASDTLGTAMDDLAGRSGVGADDGAIGVLTDGRVDRTAALTVALECALAPFRIHHYR